MSWRTRVTACLVAAFLGVFVGAVYTAVTGRSDAPTGSSRSMLPVPIEQAAVPAPIGQLAAAPSRAAGTDPRKARPPSPEKGHKASKAKRPDAKPPKVEPPKVEPPKVEPEASGNSEKSSRKGAGKATRGK